MYDGRWTFHRLAKNMHFFDTCTPTAITIHRSQLVLDRRTGWNPLCKTVQCAPPQTDVCSSVPPPCKFHRLHNSICLCEGDAGIWLLSAAHIPSRHIFQNIGLLKLRDKSEHTLISKRFALFSLIIYPNLSLLFSHPSTPIITKLQLCFVHFYTLVIAGSTCRHWNHAMFVEMFKLHMQM